MADDKDKIWSEMPPGQTYNLRTGQYKDKDVPRSLRARPAKGWQFDRDLNLWVKREPDNIEFAVDEKGKNTFTLDRVIQDNPQRAREILNTLKGKVRPEDPWLQGFIQDYERRLGTGLLGADRGKGLLTYG